jgi:hypothetical protein
VATSIQEKLQECRLKLDRLGPPRDEVASQKLYLDKISRDFQRIIIQSVDGPYKDPFFRNKRPEQGNLRLRALVRSLNDQFADVLYTRGHRWEISTFGPTFVPPDTLRVSGSADKVTKDEFMDIVNHHMRENSTTELPGTFNPHQISALFRTQAERWEGIAKAHLESVLSAVNKHLRLVTSHIAKQPTAMALQRHLIAVDMEQKRTALMAKLTELIKPYQDCDLITYSRHFNEILDGHQGHAPSQGPSQGFPSIGHPEGSELPNLKLAEKILETMGAYYKVSKNDCCSRIANALRCLPPIRVKTE